MKKISCYPVIFEKTTDGNYLQNCRIISKIYLEKILEGRQEFETKEIDSKEQLERIYFRRTKNHIDDINKLHIEYIEVEEKVY